MLSCITYHLEIIELTIISFDYPKSHYYSYATSWDTSLIRYQSIFSQTIKKDNKLKYNHNYISNITTVKHTILRQYFAFNTWTFLIFAPTILCNKFNTVLLTVCHSVSVGAFITTKVFEFLISTTLHILQ